MSSPHELALHVGIRRAVLQDRALRGQPRGIAKMSDGQGLRKAGKGCWGDEFSALGRDIGVIHELLWLHGLDNWR